jgi:hypothetical protein
VHIPYSGDRMMLLLKPSSFLHHVPRCDVRADEIVLRVVQPGFTDEQVTAAFSSFRSSVDGYLTATNADIVATTTRRDQPTRTRGGRNLTLVPTVRRTRVAVALTERANVTLAGTRGRTVRT